MHKLTGHAYRSLGRIVGSSAKAGNYMRQTSQGRRGWPPFTKTNPSRIAQKRKVHHPKGKPLRSTPVGPEIRMP